MFVGLCSDAHNNTKFILFIVQVLGTRRLMHINHEDFEKVSVEDGAY